MHVKDFMIKEAITVLPEASIKEVMKTFVEKKIGGVPIVDSGGKLLGIVTDGDILRAIKPVDQHIQNYFTYSILIEEINLESRMSEMKNLSIIKIAKTRNIVTIHPEDELKKVVQLLSKHHFKKLPVVDDENRVVGVLSRGDVIRKIQMTILEGWE
jgi:CBS domain-containing protein